MQDAPVAALIEKNYFGLLALLRRRLRDEQLAQDALNQALVTALEHLQAGRISDPTQIAGYVFQVAMNQMRNHRRKMDERVAASTDELTLQNLRDPDASAESHLDPALATQVRKIVETLPTPRDREVVRRFYLDEEEKDSICRALNLSALHFDKVIFRARQRMRSLIEAKGLRKEDFFSSMLLCMV